MKVFREDSATNAAIEVMASVLDEQDGALLGIFWWDNTSKELFGVNSSPAEDCRWYTSPQFGTKVRTGRRLHQSVWKREAIRGRDRRFKGDYTKVPRGRVFEFADTGYVVYTGSWINDCAEAKKEILYEFQLPDNTEFRLDSHWDIGHGWSNEF